MYFSPKTSADGLVFHYDTGNTVRSYLGEPTVNLLYSAGATNLTNGAGDIYGRCTKTDLGNGKYRFVNNGTGVSTVRVYTNQGDLINGATYACSVYYENLVGGIGIDWCDTGITGLNYSTNVSGRLGGYGTRGTYDGPYYFLDINFDSGGAVTLYNPQVEYKSHVTPFVAGTRSATQGLKDLTGNKTLDLSTVSFDSNAQMTFDGTDDTLDTGIPLTTLPALSNFTIECTVKIDAYPTAAPPNFYNNTTRAGVLVGATYYSGTALYWYGNSSGTACTIYGYIRGADAYRNTAGFNLTPGRYHHLVLVNDYSGGTIKLYANGTLNGSATTATQEYNPSLTPSAGNIGISKAQVDGGGESVYSYLPCQVPSVKIFNRALTADEVARNYNAIKSRFNIG